MRGDGIGAAAGAGSPGSGAKQGPALVAPPPEPGVLSAEATLPAEGPLAERREDPVARIARRVIERVLEESRRRLRFRVHEETGRIWVQVIDQQTNEVVKEIPPERYLDLVARIWELVGLLVDERA